MRIIEPVRSLHARLPPLAVTGLACAELLGLSLGTSCRPEAPAVTTGARRFELPVAGQPEADTPATARVAATRAPAAAGLPQKLPNEFARQQACAQQNCSLTGWLPDPSYAESPFEELAVPAAIWVHVLAERAKLTLPPNAALELVVVCLHGELGVRDTLAPQGGSSRPVRLSPWLGLRASSAGVEIVCETGECRAMFALIAPNSTLQSALRTPPVTTPRAAPLEVRAFQDSATSRSNLGNDQARVLFGGEGTQPTLPFSLSLLQSDAPARIAPHTHDASWESLLVLEADGDLELRGRSYPITGGESLHIAPGIRHAYAARGETRFVALQLYTPAGPEQRFLAPPTAAATDGRVPPEPP